MTKIAFIGLGTMGFPMAGHLQQRGFAVRVFNRTTSKAEAWVRQYGGHLANSIAEAVQDAGIVLSCVGNDDDLRSVVEAATPALSADAVWVDHSTVSADISRELAGRFAIKGQGFVDAPVSGGQQGAINGQLTIMCGGRQTDFDRVVPIISTYSRAVTLMGDSGAGQLTKMVNQICIGGLLQALAEAMHFGELAGLDMTKAIGVISQGAASSWQMVNRHQTMMAGQYEHGFAVDWVRKDFSICLDEARRMGVQLPVTALVDQFYAEIQRMGGGRWDTSSLLARLKR